MGLLKIINQRPLPRPLSFAGHGIGLSIVKNIVQAYGRKLRIEKSHLGGVRGGALVFTIFVEISTFLIGKNNGVTKGFFNPLRIAKSFSDQYLSH